MKKARVLKSWSKHNLPGELWPEILARLPVKSLLRFRCVSKSWRSLIHDPEFCRLHLNRFKNNCDETHLLIAQGKTIFQDSVVVSCSKTLRTTRRLGSLKINDASSIFRTLSPTVNCDNKWVVVCAVDGLVMLDNLWAVRPEFMLWNPSIRKARIAPPTPKIPDGMEYGHLGFGFDLLNKDYKNVIVVRHGLVDYKDNLHSIHVYTVGTNSWKTISGCSSWPKWPYYLRYRAAICFRGGIYLFSINAGSKDWELISFDLSTEVLSSRCYPVMAPPEYRDGYFPTFPFTLTLADGGDSLALCRAIDNEASIWVLEKSSMDGCDSTCWTKRFTFFMSYPSRLFYTRMDGVILFGSKMVKAYDPETGSEEVLVNSRGSRVINVSRYVESLMLLKD